MNFKVTITLHTHLNHIFEHFNQTLLEKISPPFPKAKVIRFDGCKQNDLVEIELDFLVTKARWISLVTESEKSDKLFLFIDEGQKTPWLIRTWKHKHSVLAIDEDNCLLIDDITYTCGYLFLDWLMLPLFWMMFTYRKPYYKNLLSKA